MTDKQDLKALIILEKLDESFPINWNMQKLYLKKIKEGLEIIEEEEEEKRDGNQGSD